MIVAVITTDHEDRRAHTAALLDEINRSGFAGKRILACDGWLSLAVADHALGFDVLTRPKGGKDNGSIVRALLAELDGAGEDTLLLEDDVELSEGALEYIEAYGVPRGLSAISWFEACFRQEARPGVYQVPAAAWSHGQAVTLPPSTVRALCAGDWDLDIGWDTNVSAILRGEYIGLHVPALVQHLGRRSVAHPERGEFPVSHTFFVGARHLSRAAIPT